MQNLHLTYPEMFDLRGISNDGSLVGASNEFVPLRTFPDGTLHPLPFASGGGMALNAAGEMTGMRGSAPARNTPPFATRTPPASSISVRWAVNTVWVPQSMPAAPWFGYYDGGQGPSRAFRASPGSGCRI